MWQSKREISWECNDIIGSAKGSQTSEKYWGKVGKGKGMNETSACETSPCGLTETNKIDLKLTNFIWLWLVWDHIQMLVINIFLSQNFSLLTELQNWLNFIYTFSLIIKKEQHTYKITFRIWREKYVAYFQISGAV